MRSWRDAVRRRLAPAHLAPDQEASVVEEMAQHLDDRFGELCASGIDEAEAERIVLEELEDDGALPWRMDGVRRDPTNGPKRSMTEAWRRDFATATRSLVRAPGLGLAVVIALALAIGANTAVFSVMQAVLVRPVAYPNADRLVTLNGAAPGAALARTPEFPLAAEFFVEYRENASQLEDLAFYQEGETTIRSGDHVGRLFVAMAPPSLFSTIGVAPILGRVPKEGDKETEVVVIGERLWTEWFGRDPAVIGKTIEAVGGLRTIVGVMGADFRFPREETALWIHDLVTEPIRPGRLGLNLIGRIRPGADRESLATELAALSRRLPERFGGDPDYADLIARFQPVVRPLADQLVGDFRRPIWILMGTTMIVLFVACANVANLLLVRANGRWRDFAVRRALGARRVDLVRAQMAEAILLAALGAAGGALVAWIGLPLLVRAAPDGIPGLSSVHVDGAALAFTTALALLAACASGLLPAFRSSNPTLTPHLRAPVFGLRHERIVRDALVVAQTAAALVLVVGAALLFQSFRALYRVDPGYETKDVFTFQVAPDPRIHGLVDGPTHAQWHYAFMDRLAALPGVEAVGFATGIPLDEGGGHVFARTKNTGEKGLPIRGNIAGGDYFTAMGIDLLAGTGFERSSVPSDPARVIVSKAAAEMLWPGEDPIGQTVAQVGWKGPDWIVRGVVEDVLLADFKQAAPDPVLYLPMVGPEAKSWVVGTPGYVIKTPRAASIEGEVRDVLREMAPDSPMYHVFTMEALARRSMARLSFTLLMLALSAGLALVLGALSIYGTLSYVVSQRTREIGIRMALGAYADDVRRMVVREGAQIALVGVAFGIVGALLAGRTLRGLLFAIEPIDPWTIGVVSVGVVVVALLASYLPARRASTVDPLRALQSE